MTVPEAMQARHSVRQYTDRPIGPDLVRALNEEITRCNTEGHLYIQLLTEAPEAFRGFLATYGLLKGVRNYIAMAGPDGDDLDERVGWYGERLVLLSQMLGLNTCWVGGTYSKKKIRAAVGEGEKLVCVIALGYGANQGRPHRNKPMESLYQANGEIPDWFRRGMEAVMLAPTAVNQQKFLFSLNGSTVSAKATGGPYSKVDLGIVKYHFEAGAGKENFTWA